MDAAAPIHAVDEGGSVGDDLNATCDIVFGVDATGLWRVQARTADGTSLADVSVPDIDLAGYATDDADSAARLQRDLRAAYPTARVTWRPGVMGSLDERSTAAYRALEIARRDREARDTANTNARASLRAAVALARAAGINTGEIAARTGYHRGSLSPRPRSSS